MATTNTGIWMRQPKGGNTSKASPTKPGSKQNATATNKSKQPAGALAVQASGESACDFQRQDPLAQADGLTQRSVETSSADQSAMQRIGLSAKGQDLVLTGSATKAPTAMSTSERQAGPKGRSDPAREGTPQQRHGLAAKRTSSKMGLLSSGKPAKLSEMRRDAQDTAQNMPKTAPTAGESTEEVVMVHREMAAQPPSLISSQRQTQTGQPSLGRHDSDFWNIHAGTVGHSAGGLRQRKVTGSQPGKAQASLSPALALDLSGKHPERNLAATRLSP